MQGIINLKNPIMIDGKTVNELRYDTNEITVLLYAEADARKKIAAGMKNVALSVAVEFDFALHLYMGIAAIVAVNPAYSFSDLERIHGTDANALSVVGRNFLMNAEDAVSSTSGEQSETTPAPTTRAQLTSKESE